MPGMGGHLQHDRVRGQRQILRPVKVGDLVEATAQLIRTGRNSMHILATVRSGNARDQLLTEATKCLMIFVAMGPDSRSTPVPPWQPITDEDREQQASAQRRIALRGDIESAMANQQHTEKRDRPPRGLTRATAKPGNGGTSPPRVDGLRLGWPASDQRGDVGAMSPLRERSAVTGA